MATVTEPIVGEIIPNVLTDDKPKNENIAETTTETKHIETAVVDTETPDKDTSKNLDIKNIFGFIESFKKFKIEATDKENTQNNGKMFENFVKDKFISIGYTDVSSKKKNIYKNLIDDIKKVYNSNMTIPNTRSYKCEKILIQQPNGSQKTPDLLLVDISKDVIQFQPIEVKTGKNSATWNNTYPKQDWIYIFSGNNGVTYFLGSSLITDDVVKIFEEYKEIRKKLAAEYNERLHALKCSWKLVDYFKFEHTSGVNYKKDDMCEEREKSVDDILLKFTGLSL